MRHAVPILLAVLLAGCAQTAADGLVHGRFVVLVSVDGLPADVLRDPKVPMPTLRRLAAEGAQADGMRVVLPSVTWPSHTTLVTGVRPGRHGVIGNSYLDRETFDRVPLLPDPLFDKDQIVKVPTIYDLAHRAGLTTAAVVWPATRNAKTLDWTVPDVGTKELWEKYSTPSWLAELREEGIPVDRQEAWVKEKAGVQRDWMYTRAAVQAIRKHRPNLVLLHLIELDHVQHAKGPRTPEADWAASHADDRIRDVVEAVEAAGLKGRATIVVTSDHGFHAYDQTLLPNVALRQAGLQRTARSLSQGGAAFVYLKDPSARAAVREALAGLDGIQLWIEPADYALHGMATPEQDPRMPDLVIAAKEGYAFGDADEGEDATASHPRRGAHGHLPSEPKLHAAFVAWGAGVRPGSRSGVIDSVDVAPTVARLLGLKMEGVEGKVLEQFLLR
jgi:predicted AlkP superfamily pyrophosphatase or phosphodiesterase